MHVPRQKREEALAVNNNTNLAEIPAGAQSLYDGRHHLGWTFQRGKAFEAVKHDRTSLGTFDTLLKARNAVWVGEC
jgi:hypothetical protein